MSTQFASSMLARGFHAGNDFPWPLIQAKDIFDLRYGKGLVESNRIDGEVPVYGTNGQCGWHNTALFEGPGVILGRKGQGPLGVEWCSGAYWVIDTAYSLELLTGRVDLKYAYYLIKYVGLNHLKDGTSNPSLTRDRFGTQYFPIPPLPEQTVIAQILGTLDDKIELNRRMNQTLEEMARALFKSWFVDFDPVRAKAEGREPVGMDAETATLFPDKFVDSEIGSIPEGWALQSLDEIAEFRNGLALQRYRPAEDDDSLPVVKIAQLRAGIASSGEWASDKIDSACIIDNGDVVFSWSGSLLVKVWCGGRAALNQHLFKVTSQEFPKWFYLMWTLNYLPEFRRIAADKATTMGHIKRHHLSQAKCVVPDSRLLAKASRVLGPLINLRIRVALQSNTLTTVRDYILPKLLSGDLRTDDPEKFLEDHLP